MSKYLDGKILEAGYFNEAHTDVDLDKVRKYLEAKHGLASLA